MMPSMCPQHHISLPICSWCLKSLTSHHHVPGPLVPAVLLVVFLFDGIFIVVTDNKVSMSLGSVCTTNFLCIIVRFWLIGNSLCRPLIVNRFRAVHS
ncbi:hypothetical protein EDB19DRAFT_1693366 [Suillus lakei]|nr:hypothetical protein EDB19DRAFT_1693366 [Suillus lakei]